MPGERRRGRSDRRRLPNDPLAAPRSRRRRSGSPPFGQVGPKGRDPEDSPSVHLSGGTPGWPCRPTDHVRPDPSTRRRTQPRPTERRRSHPMNQPNPSSAADDDRSGVGRSGLPPCAGVELPTHSAGIGRHEPRIATDSPRVHPPDGHTWHPPPDGRDRRPPAPTDRPGSGPRADDQNGTPARPTVQGRTAARPTTESLTTPGRSARAPSRPDRRTSARSPTARGTRAASPLDRSLRGSLHWIRPTRVTLRSRPRARTGPRFGRPILTSSRLSLRAVTNPGCDRRELLPHPRPRLRPRPRSRPRARFRHFAGRPSCRPPTTP